MEQSARGQKQADSFPAWPLQEFVEAEKQRSGLGWNEFGEQVGVTGRTLLRLMLQESVSLKMVDKITIALGSHPIFIYPEHYERERISA